MTRKSMSWPTVACMAFILCTVVCFCGRPASAQMINTSTPFVSVGDRYFENFGVNFGFGFRGGRGNGSRVVGLGPNGQLMPNIVFQQNNGAIPPFGGFNPGAGASFGFGRNNPGGGGFGLGFNFAKGHTRTNVTQAPSITTMNGAQGSFFHGTTQPFVIGNIPVLGNQGLQRPYAPVSQYENGVTRALKMGGLQMNEATQEYRHEPERKPVTYGNKQSTAVAGDISVDAIKAQRAAAQDAVQKKIEAAIAAAEKFSADGKQLDARLRLREALKLTDDEATTRKLNRLIKATRNR
ncbi:MAG: hypothetical protein AAFN77_21395 [Planctomycetota bacterium]